MHDVNVIGSLQLLTACEKTDEIRNIVVRGSAGIYGAEPHAPQFFGEEMARLYPLRTRFQRDVGEIENLFATFSRRHPDVVCTMLRYQPAIGPSVDTQFARYLSLPMVPTHLGFDPRIQVVHEDDALGGTRGHRAPARPRRRERGRPRHDRAHPHPAPGAPGAACRSIGPLFGTRCGRARAKSGLADLSPDFRQAAALRARRGHDPARRGSGLPPALFDADGRGGLRRSTREASPT